MSLEAVKQYEPLFGSWYVKERLGTGASGEVYLVERADAQGVISRSAVKYIHVSPYSSFGSMPNMDETNGEVGIEDILQEIQTLSAFKSCPNIVGYEEHACIPLSDGVSFDILIRMELLVSLEQYVKTHRMTEQDTIRLGADISNALAFCEGQNIIHRDIKPGNIMVSANGSFKLGDFGIAGTTEQGTIGGFSQRGTYPYMAPEIYRGEICSGSVDLYSLGLVMYQLLNNGRIPFMPPYPETARPSDKENAVYRRFSGEAIPAPANGSPQLQQIVLKACAFLPQDRYQSAAQMRNELQQLLNQPTVLIRLLSDDGSVLGQKMCYPGEHLVLPQIPDREKGGCRYKAVGWQPELPEQVFQSADYTVVWEKERNKKPFVLIAIIIAVIAAAVAVTGFVWPGFFIRDGRDGASSPGSTVTAPPETEKPTPTPSPTPKPTPSPTSEPTPESTPEPTPEPTEPPAAEPEWTKWADDLPKGVSGDAYAIECRQVYRTTNALTVDEGEEAPKSGYKYLGKKYGDWGEWSELQDKPVKKDERTDVEESKVPGYAWSAWGARIQVSYDWQIPAPTETMRVNAHYSTALTSPWYEVSYRYETTVTKYKFRTRDVQDVYYDPNGWSSYSAAAVQQKDGQLIEMKMQYRYKKTEGGSAASAPSMDNFKISGANYSKHYFDVTKGAWYSPVKNKYLQTADELGILLPDNYLRFRPDEKITVGQLIRAAVMINRIYNGYEGLICKNDGNYGAYRDYAENCGIILRGEFPDLTKEATRQEMAYVFSQALPKECLAQISSVDAISDMEMSLKYYECALTMAGAGVMSVSEDGEFRPDANVTRAEAAAMIEKLVHPGSRNAS